MSQSEPIRTNQSHKNLLLAVYMAFYGPVLKVVIVRPSPQYALNIKDLQSGDTKCDTAIAKDLEG